MESTIKVQDETILSLRAELEKSNNIVTVLNQALSDTKINFKIEKENLEIAHKKEVKSWKKDLGLAQKNHIKLEKKFVELEKSELGMSRSIVTTDSTFFNPDAFIEEKTVVCTMCGDEIYEYIPDYFCGLMMNPTCQQCHKSQLIQNPFEAFPENQMPTSMISHWTPPTNYDISSHENLPSMTSHYTRAFKTSSIWSLMSRRFEELKSLIEACSQDIRESKNKFGNDIDGMNDKR